MYNSCEREDEMLRTIELDVIGNKDMGFLSFFEIGKEIDFVIKRVYYIYGVKESVQRGMHAHKNLKQILWCPFGEIEVVLNDGKKHQSVILNKPNIAIIINKPLWRDIYWKKSDSVLCVGASDIYDEDDYIRDYDEFLKYVKEGDWDDEN
jgi:dTDP-4-dehydrorhamnose 3,5-epimerase-like enzyme